MTDHPLTDEICEGLMERTSKYPYTDDVIVDMRAAADWQLEQVLRFMEENGFGIRKILLLKDAMRPHQEDNS